VTLAPSDALEHLRLAAEINGLDAEVVVPADNDLILGGMRFHYLDWGGEGVPIVFLHGGGLNAHTWDVVCLAMRGDHRCVALDQRGHGDSEWSPVLDYAAQTHAADVLAFADEVGLDRFVLVGQSMGAMNGMAFAGRHAERLAALVLVDAGPWVERAGTKPIRDFVVAPAEVDSIEEMIERAVEFNPSRDPRLLRYSLQHNLRRTPAGKWTWKYDRRHLNEANFEELHAGIAALADHLPDISCPTLVVRGSESAVLTDEGAQRLAEALPDGRWAVVQGAGHNVQGDNPLGLVHELRRFLQGL
jgi:esterase